MLNLLAKLGNLLKEKTKRSNFLEYKREDAKMSAMFGLYRLGNMAAVDRLLNADSSDN